MLVDHLSIVADPEAFRRSRRSYVHRAAPYFVYADRRVRRLLSGFVVFIVFFTTLPATGLAQSQAVSRFEVTGGHSFLSGSDLVDGYGHGWLLGFAWNVNPQLALLMEAGSNRHRQSLGLLDADVDFHQLMAGPKLSLPAGRIRPYLQALFGGSRIDLRVTADFPFPSTSLFDETRWAYQVGGGIEAPLTDTEPRRLSVRLAFDYRRVFAIDSFGQTRVLTAVVYGFG